MEGVDFVCFVDDGGFFLFFVSYDCGLDRSC